MQKVWIVFWEDNTSVWSSKEKARTFIDSECLRIGANAEVINDHGHWLELRIVEVDNKAEYANQVDVVEYEIDNCPHFPIDHVWEGKREIGKK